MTGAYNYGEIQKLREKIKELGKEVERLEECIDVLQREKIKKPPISYGMPKPPKTDRDKYVGNSAMLKEDSLGSTEEE